MRSRITVKIGSNVLTREDGSLDVTRMSAIVDQVAAVRKMGYDVILVSSGAVASGRSELKKLAVPCNEMDSVAQRQLFSAVGQAKLIDRYYELFEGYDIPVGQVLTMKENFSSEYHCNNQKNCMEVMLEHGVVPVVNENDTVCITELMFTDNDELSALIASMMGARKLIILSNVDGLYDGDPQSRGSKLITEVAQGMSIDSYICQAQSSNGRGGMASKSHMARLVAGSGIDVYIANGKRENVICDIVSGVGVPCTHFAAYDGGNSVKEILL